MKILINTTTLVQGGALQVAVSFINELLIEHKELNFVIACSRQVAKELKVIHAEFPANFYYFDQTPAKLKTRKEIIAILNNIVEQEKIDLVFTVFGPSYWKPKCKHISGFADGWCYYPESIAFKKLGFLEKIKMKLLIKYKLFYLKRTSDYLIVETKDAKTRLSKILNFHSEKIFVVGNSYNRLVYHNEEFLNKTVNSRLNSNSTKVLTISSYYPHKNLEIIKRTAQILPKNLNIQFVLTIKNEVFDQHFKAEPKIINLGALSVFDCPSVYKACDIVLLPSLLETFSANYPEAMVMKKPIITTDLPFAHEVCGDAAIYYDADNEKELADVLIELIKSTEKQEILIKNGSERIKQFTQSNERANEYIQIFHHISNT